MVPRGSHRTDCDIFFEEGVCDFARYAIELERSERPKSSAAGIGVKFVQVFA